MNDSEITLCNMFLKINQIYHKMWKFARKHIIRCNICIKLTFGPFLTSKFSHLPLSGPWSVGLFPGNPVNENSAPGALFSINSQFSQRMITSGLLVLAGKVLLAAEFVCVFFLSSLNV